MILLKGVMKLALCLLGGRPFKNIEFGLVLGDHHLYWAALASHLFLRGNIVVPKHLDLALNFLLEKALWENFGLLVILLVVVRHEEIVRAEGKLVVICVTLIDLQLELSLGALLFGIVGL